MAGAQLGTHVDFNFTNSLKATATTSANGDNNLTDATDYLSVNAMFTVLNAFDPLTYTDERLRVMSVNDLVFAVRNIQDPTSIANYIPAQVARS